MLENFTRGRKAAVSAIIGAGVLAGSAWLATAANGSPDVQIAEPALSAVSTVTDWHQIALPLDSYETNLKDEQVILRAEYDKTKECMASFGFDFNAPRWDRDVDNGNGGQPAHYRLYGLLDADHAARDGYHSPGVQDPAEEKYSEETHSVDYYNVIAAKTGGGTYNGKQIPEGGCVAEARREVAGGAEVDESLPETLGAVTWDSANTDSRVTAAFAAWSSCMKAAGYSYATPMDANDDPKWWTSDTASKDEIAVALADVQCKKDTNLVGIRMAVDAAYQQIQIKAHAAQLATLKTAQQRQVTNATAFAAANTK